MEAIAQLQKNAFINSELDINRETFRFSLLPLTADFVSRKSRENSAVQEELQDKYKTYLVERGRYEEALSQIAVSISKEVLPEKERLSNMLIDAAYRAYQAGNYKEAIERLQKARSYKENANLYYTWGVIEREEGAYGAAMEYFKKAIQLDPKRISVWRSWGNMEKGLKNYHFLGVSLSHLAGQSRNYNEKKTLMEQAADALNKGFYSTPIGYRERHHNVVNAHALALSLARLNKKDEAIKYCIMGLEIEPQNERLLELKKSLL
jgi:tetratricopeptide (TPR) repeat protein